MLPSRALLALAAGATVACGCGSAAGHAHAPGAGAGSRAGRASACARTDARALEAIAQRIADQAATGRNVVAARRRLARSLRLAQAVGQDSPTATVAALRPLLRHQITRIDVWGPDGRALAQLGTTAAPSPVTGTITDALGLPIGRYVLSVSSDAALAGELAAVTGGAARVGAAVADAPTAAPAGGATAANGASGTAAGPPAAILGVSALAFPSGPLRVSIGVSPALLRTCAATPEATRMAVIADVGRRLLASEAGGVQARRVLRHVTRDRGLRRAVAHRDPVALRAAIIRFFRTRSLHVVRIRATDARGRLIGDVGGPYVIAPLSGPVRDAGGRLVGRVTLSVQDDMGYIKLLHRFTGARVALDAGALRVPGSTPLPAHPAARATLRATAFPSGPLTVRLALP